MSCAYICVTTCTSDGSKFTAEDVLFNLSRGVKSASRNIATEQLITKAARSLMTTIDIATYGPYPALLACMLDNGWVMISKNYFENTDYADFIRKPMGTGPGLQ